jgi:hypothetical protein
VSPPGTPSRRASAHGTDCAEPHATGGQLLGALFTAGPRGSGSQDMDRAHRGCLDPTDRASSNRHRPNGPSRGMSPNLDLNSDSAKSEGAGTWRLLRAVRVERRAISAQSSRLAMYRSRGGRNTTHVLKLTETAPTSGRWFHVNPQIPKHRRFGVPTGHLGQFVRFRIREVPISRRLGPS